MNYTLVMLKLLDFLGQDPDTPHHVRELAEEAGVSTGAASMTLTAMHGSGLVDLDVKGNMKFYKFNIFNPVARQFKVLFTVQRLKKLVDDLSKDSDRVVLFGSAANGTDARDSDWDLFVETGRPDRVKDALRRSERELNRDLHPTIVPPGGLTKIQRKDRPLFESILQGRILWPPR